MLAPKTVNPAPLCGRHRTQRHDVRHRSRRHRKKLTWQSPWRCRAFLNKPRGAHHSCCCRCRGRRAARLFAGNAPGKGGSLPAPALRRSVRHDGRRKRVEAAGTQHHRDCPAGVYARAHAERLLHHSRRGAEYDSRANEDGFNQAGLQLKNGCNRRPYRNRSPRPARGAGCSMRRKSSKVWKASLLRGSTSAMWFATALCSALCRAYEKYNEGVTATADLFQAGRAFRVGAGVRLSASRGPAEPVRAQA